MNEVKHLKSLCEAARVGSLDLVKKRSEKIRAGLGDVDSCDTCGYAPLLYACKSGNIEVCRYLIDTLKANIYVRTVSPFISLSFLSNVF